jgi:hypothetical protein
LADWFEPATLKQEGIEMKVILVGSHGMELDRERVPQPKEGDDENALICQAVRRLVGRCVLSDGDQIKIDLS